MMTIDVTLPPGFKKMLDRNPELALASLMVTNNSNNGVKIYSSITEDIRSILYHDPFDLVIFSEDKVSVMSRTELAINVNGVQVSGFPKSKPADPSATDPTRIPYDETEAAPVETFEIRISDPLRAELERIGCEFVKLVLYPVNERRAILKNKEGAVYNTKPHVEINVI